MTLGSFRTSAAAWAVALAVSAPAFADDGAPKSPPAPESSLPSLELKVGERGPGLPWTMALANTGDRAAVVAADPRLLWFEVEVPGKKKTSTCRLPSELFPNRPDKRTLVLLEPGEGVAQSFDPRLYCFTAGGQWQLVPGSIVTPHFGWPQKMKTTWKGGKRVTEPAAKQIAPFVAGAAPKKGETTDPDADGVKEFAAEPFALRSDYAEWSRTRLDADRKARDHGPLQLKVTQGSDAEAERNATVRITLKNRSKRTERVYFRRELVSYEVMRPDGLVTCDPQPDLRAPDRQAFATLGPGRSLSVVSRLVEMCPTGTFGQPGLYLVHARFDSVEAGDDWNIEAFIGRVVSPSPATVRIRTGDQPFLKKRRMHFVKVPQAKR